MEAICKRFSDIYYCWNKPRVIQTHGDYRLGSSIAEQMRLLICQNMLWVRVCSTMLCYQRFGSLASHEQ